MELSDLLVHYLHSTFSYARSAYNASRFSMADYTACATGRESYTGTLFLDNEDTRTRPCFLGLTD